MITKGFTNRYTMLDNEIICDKALNLKSLGVYAYLVFVCENANFSSLEQIRLARKIQKEDFQEALKELEKYGYIEKNKKLIKVLNMQTRKRFIQ